MKRRAPALGWAIVAGSLAVGMASVTLSRPPAPVEWRLTDLTLVQPRSGQGGWKPITTTLGRRLGWPGSAASAAADAGLAGAGEVQALEQRPGQPMVWPVRSARRAPFLSFTPLDGAGASFRIVTIDRAGRRHFEREIVAVRLDGPAPASIEIQLPPGTTALRLEARANDATTAGASERKVVWGMPTLYTAEERQPESRDTREGRETRPKAHSRPPHVVLIGIDTLRADALGPTGLVTPNLDAFASHADVWENAYSTCNATNPSFASILTGLYPKNHGVSDLTTPLAEDRLSLAEIYAAHGYRTEAVIAARHLGSRHSGMTQGFQGVTLAPKQYAAEAAVDSAIRLLQSTRAPIFLWLHLFDPHTPHTPARPFSEGFMPSGVNGLRQPSAWRSFRDPGLAPFLDSVLGGNATLYAGEVAALDRQLGRLFEVLERGGMADTTVVAVVSDHGENLGEHGVFYRHAGLFETTTHVPLMIRSPEFRHRAATRRKGLVQTLDLFPTLLRVSGLPVPANDGLDLYELTPQPSSAGRRVVFAEEVGGGGAALRTPDWRYAELARGAHLATGAYLFDLQADPLEERNLAGRGLPIESELARALRAWRNQRRPPSGEAGLGAQPTPEELAQLRALGYL